MHKGQKSVGMIVTIAGVVVTSLLGSACEEFMAMRAKSAAEQREKESAMREAAKAEDGHVWFDGGNGAIPGFAGAPSVEGKPWKSCVTMKRYVLEPGESGNGQVSYDAKLKDYVQPLIDQGKLPRDRLYLAANSSQFIVSVPMSERADLAQNMEAGDVCIWSNGEMKTFPNPVKGSSHGDTPVQYAALEKWDGVLKHKPAPSAAPTTSGAAGTGQTAQ